MRKTQARLVANCRSFIILVLLQEAHNAKYAM